MWLHDLGPLHDLPESVQDRGDANYRFRGLAFDGEWYDARKLTHDIVGEEGVNAEGRTEGRVAEEQDHHRHPAKPIPRAVWLEPSGVGEL